MNLLFGAAVFVCFSAPVLRLAMALFSMIKAESMFSMLLPTCSYMLIVVSLHMRRRSNLASQCKIDITLKLP